MFDWLKNKVAKVPESAAAKALRTELELLNEVPNAPPRIVDLLVNYVFKGEGERVVADLASLKNTHLAISYVSIHQQRQRQKGFPELLKHLPQDPEVLLRLAKVYDAVQTAGAGVTYIYDAPKIPAFQGSLSWLSTFLIELSKDGKQEARSYPVGLVLAMIKASGEDPNVLVRGPFFYNEADLKNPLDRYAAPPYPCFRCLDQFPELVLKVPDLIKPAFQQKEATNRANVLRAFTTLEIPVDPFVEEIVSLAVSGSKEVRESAVPLLEQHFANFKDSLKHYAEKGSADQRYHAVRWLAQVGGEAEREFLTQRLASEKSEKVCAAIREAVAEATSTQTETEDDDYNFPEIPEVPVVAPLDKAFRAELHEIFARMEKALAEGFKKHNPQLQWTRTPTPPEAIDRFFAALQNFVVGDRDLAKYFGDNGSVYTGLLNHPMPPHFQLIHVIRWCLLVSGAVDPNGKTRSMATRLLLEPGAPQLPESAKETDRSA